MVCFGPLTNFAMACHIVKLTRKDIQLSSVRINGGNLYGVGNVVGSPSAEGNFFYDPEAVHIIFTVILF